ncbi:unnamed protein product [Candidula unifasciata]|uniref:Sorting nexin-25 n=1 Tax=Candidula unifasciata TaxID=100452 RepID=A0A8S3YJB7_9EUPU|nr:unnamed protein product [Candidula unifasciata]
MNECRFIAVGAVVTVGSVAVYSGWLWTLTWVTIYLLVAGLGFYYAVQWNLVRGKNYKPAVSHKDKNTLNIIIRKMVELEACGTEQPRKVVISRNLDNSLQEVLDLVVKHLITTWYEALSKDKTFIKQLQAEMWNIIDKVSRRLSEVDLVRFLSQDVVDCLHRHFKSIRLAKRFDTDRADEDSPKFMLHSWLVSDESELDCLRKVSDAVLLLLLSKPYATCAPVRHLLREIIGGSVLKPMIDLICEPDYINQKLLDYLSYREKQYADTKRTYMYSATYEGFMKMIKSSESIADLRQMRYNIISEILQASAINNLKKQQGLTTDKDVVPKGTNKGELLKARNLERYKNQLTVAKQLCEKRILSLGGTIYESSLQNPPSEEDIPGQKVFSFSVILEMPKGREYFMKFLKKEGAESFLGFWIAVEKLKTTAEEEQHRLATEVYQQYIASSSSQVRFDKSLLKGMEEFLRGDKGPEAFMLAQKQVQQLLEDQYYPSFIVSDTYFLLASSTQGGVTSDEENTMSDELFLESADIFDEGEESLIAGQSYRAQQLLRALDSKITNKARALRAQRSSQKVDGGSKLKKVQEDMEQELENLKQERHLLEMHIARTQKWIDNIGQWNAQIYDASIKTEDDRKIPQFVVLVSLCSEDQTIPAQVSSSSEGWAISRTLEDFHVLHEKLAPISKWAQKKELPTCSKLFKSVDSAFMQKAWAVLNEYLAMVMKDEKMVHSEALYAFLSPTPEFVYQAYTAEKKKFSLAAVIRSLPTMRSDNPESDEDFMFGADDSSEKDKNTDSIAKPLYRLVGEVFELQGMFRFFRRSLMSFVELTFGRSIDRQLKATVDWLVSEQMLIYYTQTFKDSFWPDGDWAKPSPPRSDQQKLDNRIQAKTKLLENMPDTLKTLVGEDNGRRGMIKIFEVLQNKNLNKHLLYNLLEIILLELLPEMKKAKDTVLCRHKVRRFSQEQETDF